MSSAAARSVSHTNKARHTCHAEVSKSNKANVRAHLTAALQVFLLLIRLRLKEEELMGLGRCPAGGRGVGGSNLMEDREAPSLLKCLLSETFCLFL